MEVQLHLIDYIIMVIYFVFVLGIGWFLRKYMKYANNSWKQVVFASLGHGLAFISTNLGALEVMGMTGSGAKYGMLTTHFYWIGAIPAMVFRPFLMRFYYGSKARSVPEFLKSRFDEKARALNAILFAVMTIMASVFPCMHLLYSWKKYWVGISMSACGYSGDRPCLHIPGWFVFRHL